jgi:hypothetical protein
MGPPLLGQIPDIFHLDYKNKKSKIAVLCGTAKPVNVFDAPFRRRVWKEHRAIFLKRDAFHFGKRLLQTVFHVKIEPLIAVARFRF